MCKMEPIIIINRVVVRIRLNQKKEEPRKGADMWNSCDHVTGNTQKTSIKYA